MKKIIAIIGARPQFIKHASVELELKKEFELLTIHTGQHYDENMSQVFFDQLGMLKPKYKLSLGGGTHGEQTGKMMIEIEKVLLKEKPNGILVYGDTNSTLAASLVAVKLQIPIFHIEAGLRSFNDEMPEEINRRLTDSVADILFAPNQQAVNNLKKEGITKSVYVVGDIMKDMLNKALVSGLIKKPDINEKYYYATLHRPYNVDIVERLLMIFDSLSRLNNKVIFSMHPRTYKNVKEFRLDVHKNIILIEPQPYFENLGYVLYSEGLITDSGGMQKEAYWLEKQCITIRSETEWVETIENGANILLFDNLIKLQDSLDKKDVFWDSDLYGSGTAARRTIELIKDYFC